MVLSNGLFKWLKVKVLVRRGGLRKFLRKTFWLRGFLVKGREAIGAAAKVDRVFGV
jgi:hypothetical protein